nr:MAG TPA: hypothetical protein [Caudoviricetes sp.]
MLHVVKGRGEIIRRCAHTDNIHCLISFLTPRHVATTLQGDTASQGRGHHQFSARTFLRRGVRLLASPRFFFIE